MLRRKLSKQTFYLSVYIHPRQFLLFIYGDLQVCPTLLMTLLRPFLFVFVFLS